MCCISSDIPVHVQSSGDHIGFRSWDLPSLLMVIFHCNLLVGWLEYDMSAKVHTKNKKNTCMFRTRKIYM